MKTYKNIKLWERPSNYAGSTFYDYYVGFGRHRDSDILDNSNFEVALEKLGGESETVIVSHSGHWAVGWVECILVHKDDLKSCATLDELKKSYENYPVLDDSDYSEREYESYSEWADQVKNELAGALSVHFGVKLTKTLIDIAYRLEMEAQFYGGPDHCLNIYANRKPDTKEIDELRRHLREMDCQYNKSRVYKSLCKKVGVA